MKKTFLFVFFLTTLSPLCAQLSVTDTLTSRFNAQLFCYPQEKIWLHTDKPYYISGEKIWFRAFLADAASHKPMLISKYVYVELINPLDSIVCRLKIREKDEAFFGFCWNLLLLANKPFERH
ncbi:MAG: hypothetical protein LBC84_05615 [Prevotellaceae bacterium]|jgi:uncharacterized protein YfaS (alpha-2-macroglobulin family)|nr:hypothetical protein [Prevotellaceae bacterium]